jgi:hypothetical protein
VRAAGYETTTTTRKKDADREKKGHRGRRGGTKSGNGECRPGAVAEGRRDRLPMLLVLLLLLLLLLVR